MQMRRGALGADADAGSVYDFSPDRHERGRRHLAVAWAGCKIDGRLHVDQWRAVSAVIRGFDLDADPEPRQTPHDVAESLLHEAPRLSEREREQLFATASWVMVSDGRTHGRELWLLCELRRALDLPPRAARLLLRLAKLTRLRSPAEPTLRELEALHRAVARRRRAGEADTPAPE